MTMFGITQQSYKIGKNAKIAKLIKLAVYTIFVHSYETPASFRVERPIIDFVISISICRLFLHRK